MNKGIIIVLILVLAGAGAVVVSKQNRKAAQMQETQLKDAAQAKIAAAEQLKQKALEEAKRIEAEAAKAKQLALEEAKKAEEAAKRQVAELQAKVNGLIVQAKSSLNGGQFQEAVTIAKNVLGLDANNTEAKSILDTATAKIKEAAQQQAVSGALPASLGK